MTFMQKAWLTLVLAFTITGSLMMLAGAAHAEIIEGWPDALSNYCVLTDGTFISTTTAIYFIGEDSQFEEIGQPPQDRFVNYYNPTAGQLGFDFLTRNVVVTAYEDCIPTGTSIDDVAYLIPFDFGQVIATTTQTLIHNPTLDMYLGIMLFFFVFVFFVWFFRRPYDTY